MKRIQIALTNENIKTLEAILERANTQFTDGRVNISDCVNFAIESCNFDIDLIRTQKIDPKKVLMNAAKDDSLSIDDLLEKLKTLKSIETKAKKRKQDNGSLGEVKS